MSINSGGINGAAINTASVSLNTSFSVTLESNGAGISGIIPTTLAAKGVVSRKIHCVLKSGVLNDLPVVISSVNGTLNNDGGSRLGIVVPLASGVEELVAPYLAEGVFQLEYEDIDGNGSSASSFSEEFTIDSVRQDTGSKSNSLTLSGLYTEVNPSPAVIPIQGISFTALQVDGRTRIRCDFDRDFKQGCIAQYDNGATQLTSEQVTYVLSPRIQYMELVG